MLKGTLIGIPFFILAQVPGPMGEPTSWLSMGWIIAGIFGLVGLANQGLELWGRVFPKEAPPGHQIYATKAELKQQIEATKEQLNQEIERIDDTFEGATKRIEDRFEQWLKQMEDKLGTDGRDLHRWQQEIERGLGRVEAKAEQALIKK